MRGPDGLVATADVRARSPGQVRSTVAESGVYEIRGLPPGDALAWASSDALATTYFPDADRPNERVALTEGEVFRAMHLTLPPEARIHGQLDVPDGFLGGSVLVYNDARTVGFGAQVDSSGRFEVDGLHGGQYTMGVVCLGIRACG